MSVKDSGTTDDNPTDDRFERELISLLCGLGEDAEPWKVRPPETSTGPAKLLVGAREGVVRGRLEGSGYEIRDLGFPVEDDGWIAAWEVSQ